MSDSFDLSPVIGLLRVLPARASSPSSESSGKESKPADNEPRTTVRQLGDFTALWRYLADTATVAEPRNETQYRFQPSALSTPDTSARGQWLSSSPKKPRRFVTFSPGTLGVADEAANSASPAFISSTGLKFALDDRTCTGVKALDKHASKPVIASNTTAEARKLSIIQKLIFMFPEAKATLLKPSQLSPKAITPDGVHVFVDNSNVCLSPTCLNDLF